MGVGDNASGSSWVVCVSSIRPGKGEGGHGVLDSSVRDAGVRVAIGGAVVEAVRDGARIGVSDGNCEVLRVESRPGDDPRMNWGFKGGPLMAPWSRMSSLRSEPNRQTTDGKLSRLTYDRSDSAMRSISPSTISKPSPPSIPQTVDPPRANFRNRYCKSWVSEASM